MYLRIQPSCRKLTYTAYTVYIRAYRMGIPGLFQMLKRYAQHVHIQTCVKEKTVAIDIFTYLHKSKGDKETVQQDLAPFLANASRVIAVFDGSPSEQRSNALSIHVSKRTEIIESIRAIRQTLNNPETTMTKKDTQHLLSHIHILEKEAWQPSPEYMWDMYEYLQQLGVECIVLNKGEEADMYLPTIAGVDIIVSNDSDLLANGAKNLLRTNGLYYNRQDILEGLQFTEDNWNIFIKLCRTMKHPQPEFIFTAMKLYAADEEYICERYEDYFTTSVLI